VFANLLYRTTTNLRGNLMIVVLARKYSNMKPRHVVDFFIYSVNRHATSFIDTAASLKIGKPVVHASNSPSLFFVSPMLDIESLKFFPIFV